MTSRFLSRKSQVFALTLLLNFGFLFVSQSTAQDSSRELTRTWSDSSGKFEVTAALQSQNENEVVLRTEAGKEIRVQKSRLSERDLEYLAKLNKETDAKTDSSESTSTNDSANEKDLDASDSKSTSNPELVATLKDRALEFYNDLRTKERTIAIGLLTPAAQELAKQQQSELSLLPTPDEGKQSIRIGKPTIKDNLATIPVTVRVNKENHKTIIHFAKDDQDNWHVTAISAVMKNQETKINFEAGAEVSAEKDSMASLVGKSIELTGLTLDGTPVSLDSLKGKVVLIDFWATWCGPCRAEIPNILENYEKYHEAGFEVLAVSTDKDLEALTSFVEEEQPPWIVLADRHPKNQESMAKRFKITGIPTFILVDRDGKVFAVNCRGSQLGKKLEELFASDVSLTQE